MDQDTIANFQRQLNTLGAILTVDGNFGPITKCALLMCQGRLGVQKTGQFDGDTISALNKFVSVATPPVLDWDGLSFIAQQEVGSVKRYESLPSVVWPGGSSGFTIGIGYDLRFNAKNFVQDWKDFLSTDDLSLLKQFTGKVGDKTKINVTIPYSAAWLVFTGSTLPYYVKLTLDTFAGLDKLNVKCQTALVSLVYNRGARLDGKGREDMAKTADAIKAGNLSIIPDLLKNQANLWPNGSDLYKRRGLEADLFKAGLDA